MSDFSIDRRRIEIWRATWDADAGASRAAEEYEKLLSADELRRAERYTNIEARRQFVIGRGLLRKALAECTGSDPREFAFNYNAHGKPLLSFNSPLPLGEGSGVRADGRESREEGRERREEGGEGKWMKACCTANELDFSVSHTRGMAVCAVACGGAVGVDVEHRRRRMPHLVQLARRFFAPAEAAVVEAAAAEKQAELFFRFWTLKEAYIKALGTGMATPLASFAFTLISDHPPEIGFAAKHVSEEKPSDWQFFQFNLGGNYQLALAVRRATSEPSEISFREV